MDPERDDYADPDPVRWHPSLVALAVVSVVMGVGIALVLLFFDFQVKYNF